MSIPRPRLTGKRNASPARPKLSAGVIPYRPGPGGTCEVFWVRRSKSLRFMGGWHAFPGGRMSLRDARVAVRGTMDGDRAYRASGPPAGHPACAFRELFEETGILAVSGRLPTADVLDTARSGLIADRLDFADWLAGHDLALDASRLRYAGRWVTPPLSPLRFDATFFLLEWTPGEAPQPVVIPGELDSGEWIRPADALNRWADGEALLAQPTLETLRVLSEHGPDGRKRLWRSEARNPDSPRPIEFRPGVRAIPLATETLPPATHTNALLFGCGDLLLADPGSADRDEVDRLAEIVAGVRQQAGGDLAAILLSHHHGDHVGGAGSMRERFSAPVWAHRETAIRLSGQGLRVDRLLQDGEAIDLAGSPPLRIRVLHTPGHARGHLCLYEERTSTLACGDMLSGYGTVVIGPPDGNMSDYLDSLERLESLGARVALPSHGSLIPDAGAALRAARDHRLWREERVRDAWESGLREPQSMLGPVYGELDPAAAPIAVRQLLAHLERLESKGRIGPLPRGIRASLEQPVDMNP